MLVACTSCNSSFKVIIINSILPAASYQRHTYLITLVLISATVQAYFRLQRPVAVLIPFLSKLEYDINEEIGIPSAKVYTTYPLHALYNSFKTFMDKSNSIID